MRVNQFVPCPLERVPPPVVHEYCQIFEDLGGDLTGYITREDIVDAFEVDGIKLSPSQLESVLHAMDPSGSNVIDLDNFVACMYALTLQYNEMQGREAYSIFPDSDFTVDTATGWFKWKRWLWTVSKTHT